MKYAWGSGFYFSNNKTLTKVQTRLEYAEQEMTKHEKLRARTAASQVLFQQLVVEQQKLPTELHQKPK